jgi:hypothetical protein
MKQSLETYEENDLAITISRTSTTATITWHGSSNSRDPSQFIDSVAVKLIDSFKDKSVTLDISKLKYMNSATVVPLLSWIKRLDASVVATRVLYDEEVDWQRVNFRCMKTIARTLTHVRVEAIHHPPVSPDSDGLRKLRSSR